MKPGSSKAIADKLAGFDSGEMRGREPMLEAVASQDPELIVRAAKLIAKHRWPGFEAALTGSYQAIRRDPGCLAREAVLQALEAIESSNAALFAEAAIFTQVEKKRDTAGRVREQAVLSLARTGHADQLLLFGAALGDASPGVRLAGARAISHLGLREGAGLLLLRLGAGDAESEVAMECLRGLFKIAPDHAVRTARALLANETTRELALHALGSTPDDRAIVLLGEELSCVSHERAVVIESLALSLRPAARELLIGLVRSDRDAEAVLTALAVHRYDARLVERLREATPEDLAQRFRELYEA